MTIYIALDIDGTTNRHRYPKLGKDLGAVYWLGIVQRLGCKIVLNTMRDGQELEAAAAALEEAGIRIYGKNVNPAQKSWTTSPKVYAHIYIDDAALGAPIVPDDEEPGRFMFDWNVAGPMLVARVKQLMGIE